MYRSTLYDRIGLDRATKLFALRNKERAEEGAGLREIGQPSRAEFEIDRALMRSDFTPDERVRIRTLLDINPRDGVMGL